MGTHDKTASGSRVTVRDVADKAGVSPMTVSRALRRPELLARETLEVVRNSIREVGYIPNNLAGSLSRGYSGQVALLIPAVVNRLFADVVDGFSDVLESRGVRLLLGNFHYDDELCARQISALLGWFPDALVVVGAVPAVVRPLVARRAIPVVELMELLDDPMDINIGISHPEAGVAAADYLLGCGYTRALCLHTDPSIDKRAHIRAQAFADRWRRAGHESPSFMISAERFPQAGGRRCMEELLRAGSAAALPECIFCSNDELAFGALMACQAAGVRVPEDMGIMGFNGLEISRQCLPRLTTIKVDCLEMSRRGAELIFERLPQNDTVEQCSPKAPVLRLDAGFTVLEGSSTRPPRGAVAA